MLAVPVVGGGRSQGTEPFVLTDVLPVLTPPNCPFDNLLYPLPLVAPLSVKVGRQVLAQHVRLHQPIAACGQETDRHDRPQAAGLQLARDL